MELPPLELTESPSWRQRTLRPVGPGSLRGSVLNLATAAIGAAKLRSPRQFYANEGGRNMVARMETVYIVTTFPVAL